MTLSLQDLRGGEFASGRMNVLWPDVQVGGATATAWVQVVNVGSGIHTDARTYLALDTAATYQVAVADPISRAVGYMYDVATLTVTGWTSAITYAAGLALPDLTSGQKCLLAVRVNPVGGAVAYPARPALIVQSTGPA